MAALDHQLGFVDETTYGLTPVPALSRFFEYDSEGIEESAGRTEGDPLRKGNLTARFDRFTPYFEGASGPIELAVLTKGFGFLLKHMLGQVATTGPVETAVYTHTATMADLYGKSFVAQLNRPLHPTGANQAFTYRGGKVTEWELSNDVDGRLMLNLDCDFQQVDTTTALATAAYPANMDELTWAGGVLQVAGANYDVTEFSIKGNNGLDTDRRQIRGNTDKKEPTGARREVEFSFKADFDSMAQRTRVNALTRAGALAVLTGTWTGPILAGTTIYPSLQVSVPAARFDQWKAATEGPEGIEQEVSGAVRYDGTNSPVTMIYRSTDTTA